MLHVSKILIFLRTLKSKISFYFYCKKVDYVKMTFVDYVVSYCVKFLLIFLLISLLLVLPILCLVSAFPLNKLLTELLQSHSTNYINELALTIYGLQLTVFSIAIALKYKRIYGISEFKIGMTHSKRGNSISYFMIMTNIYLVLLVIGIIIDSNNKTNSFYLLVYSTILLLKYSSWIKKTTAEVYYDYKCFNIKNNVLLRKKGNVLSVLNDENKTKYFDEMLEKSIDKELVKIHNYFLEFEKSLFYKAENDINDEVELFEIYLSKYFKSIKNDAQLFGTLHTFNKFNEILLLISENKKYLELEEIMTLILNEYIKMLKSYNVKRRFKDIKKVDILSSDDKKTISKIYLRNLFLLMILEINIKLLNEFIENQKNNINGNIFGNSLHCIKMRITSINEIIKKYESENTLLLKHISDTTLIKEATSSAIDEIASVTNDSEE